MSEISLHPRRAPWACIRTNQDVEICSNTSVMLAALHGPSIGMQRLSFPGYMNAADSLATIYTNTYLWAPNPPTYVPKLLHLLFQYIDRVIDAIQLLLPHRCYLNMLGTTIYIV